MTSKPITVKVPKQKTYNFKGKTVIAVPKTGGCEGCEFNTGYMEYGCESVNQRAAKAPNCVDKKIIFKLATDEKS